MSIYPDVAKQDLINFSQLSEQQKSQQAIEIINRILKQTLDKKLSESF